MHTETRVDRRACRFTLAVAAGASVFGFWLALPHVSADVIARTPLATALLACGAAGVPVFLLASWRIRRGAPPASWVLGLAIAALLLGWLGFVAVSPSFHPGRVGCFFAAWATLACGLVWLGPKRTAARARGPLAFAACGIALFGGEVALRVVVAIAPSPLLATASATTQQRFRAYAFAPGHEHFGARTNTLGFYDSEFLARDERTRSAVAVLGDSFSASFVPFERHYTTVAERALRSVDLWNVGWPAMGPAEYRAMLEQFVLPRDPDAVVVSLFLGNDVVESSSHGPFEAWLASWFDRANVLLLELPRRLARMAAAAPAKNGPMALAGDLQAARAWIDDPLREPATMSEETFLRIEVERAVCNAEPHGPRWDSLTQELLAMRALVGDRPFGVVLIPDESMVEDELWSAVEAAHGAPLARHALREKLVAWCAASDIPCLDLWPALRDAEPWPTDGKRHLYLLRDTHWNARGNAVAGAELARFVAEHMLR